MLTEFEETPTPKQEAVEPIITAPVESVEPVAATPTEVEQEPKKEVKPASNAFYSFHIDSPIHKNAAYHISLPSLTLNEFNDKLKSFSNLNIDDPSEELKKWKEVTEQSLDYYTVGSLYQKRFNDEKSEFKQGIETKDKELNSISTLKFKKSDGELKGEIAILKVSKLLGLGDVITIPLPHSGIWVTIKPPTEKDLIDFYNNVFREKIMLGRATSGLTLTNFSAHINNRLFEFILKHVHSINYSDISKDDLKNYILIYDFPILAWGFACTMYPAGFDYQRACVEDIEQCTYVAKATINLTKLLWVDNPSLTDAQKIILSDNRPNKLTAESYRKFLLEHTRVVSSTFTTKNGLKFKLKIPTFNEYTTDGLAWINKINSIVDNVTLLNKDDEDSKLEVLNQYVKSSILKQFNHFIDYVEVDENIINDRSTINELLEMLSSDDETRTEITSNIVKFKENTTLAVIGIPDYKCPNCGKEQNKEQQLQKFVNVIPLDVMNLFFTLITLRISKILEREV